MSFKYGWWGVGGHLTCPTGALLYSPTARNIPIKSSSSFPHRTYSLLFSHSLSPFISLSLPPPSHSLFPHQLFLPLASSCDFSHPYVSPMGNILFPMYFITNISHYILLSLCAFFLLFLSSPSHYFPTPSSSKIDDAPHLS